MKTVLVPMENDDAMRSALETALLLARRCNGYIEGFALLLRTVSYLGAEAMVDVPVPAEELEEEAKKARQIFASFMQEHDVPQSTKTTGGCHSAG